VHCLLAIETDLEPKDTEGRKWEELTLAVAASAIDRDEANRAAAETFAETKMSTPSALVQKLWNIEHSRR